MKKALVLLVAIVIGLSSFWNLQPVSANNDRELTKGTSLVLVEKTKNNQFFYYFYRVGCPFCDKVEIWFAEELKPKFPELEIRKIRIDHGFTENIEFYTNLAVENFGITPVEGLGAVPVVFIGNNYLVGLPFSREEERIKKLVEFCLEYGCISPTKAMKEEARNLRLLDPILDPNLADPNLIIDLPLFGEVNIREVGFPIFTIMIAALDGFNPCAMWILLFLLAYAIKEKSRKKMILVAGTFILTSAVFYFFLLAAWLELFKFFVYVDFLKILIGVLALLVGFFQIRSFFKKEQGCPISGKESKGFKKINEKIKNIFAANSLKIIIPGTIFLALSVNLFEFFCSAGFPVIFTSTMALQEFPRYLELFFIGLYTFIFMLDQIIIFTVAFVTLKVATIGDNIVKWINLIGGLLMILLGILLIFFPEYLIIF